MKRKGQKLSQVEIVEPELPKLQSPRNLNEAATMLREGQKDIGKIASRAALRFYRQGAVAAYAKKKVGYGNFTPWIEEKTLYHPRTIRRYIEYYEKCKAAGKIIKPIAKTD